MQKRLIVASCLVLTAGIVLQSAAAEPFKEVGGLVVMEAEHFTTSDVRGDAYKPNTWQVETAHAGYVGTGYVTQNTPNTGGTNGTWDSACELTYDITFSAAGTYSIWLRRFSVSTSANSCFLGLDGVQIGATIDSDAPANNQWVWMKANATVAVITGKHTLNLRRRERGYCVDRIVMTTDSAYTPSGDGPAESLQGTPAKATTPNPTDKATDMPRDTILSWKPGPFAAAHNVYLGASLADVTAASAANSLGVLASEGQDANTFDPPGVLVYGQTYYWRVDEVNAPSAGSTVFGGDVWSFTVEPVGYPVKNIATSASGSGQDMGPEKTVDGSGLDANDLHSTLGTAMWLSDGVKPAWIQYALDDVYKLSQMWVWNSNQSIEANAGFGAKDVTIEYSVDGITWTTLPGVTTFAKAPGAAGYAHNTTVSFAGAVAKYVKLTINSNWGGIVPQTGLSEVRFFYIPVQAREPQPTSTQTGLAPEVTLSWRSGREAASHQVYFGTDANALPLAGTVTQGSFTPAGVNLGTTYYWRVDEVNAAETPSLWTGKVWSFSTRQYNGIDDMESYNDSDNRIFDTWVDGFSTPTTNGGLVGYDSSANGTFGERTIIHPGAGKQSMPFRYNNASPITNAEGERTWSTAQDWTVNGANTLSLWFRGNPIGFVELASDHILMNGIGSDIYSTADQGRFVYKQLSGDGTIVARVDRLDNTNDWDKAGVMIRQTLDSASIWAMSLFGTGTGNGFRFQTRATTGGAGASDTATATEAQKAILVPLWLKLERSGNVFNAYYATVDAPTTWLASPSNPQTIVMGSAVYIGLAVTSHSTTAVTQAEFSSIATTGNVTGNWQSVDLGTTVQPAGNTLDTLYITVKDSTGKSVTVKHPDPLAVTAGTWTQWTVPFSNLTGISANKVKSMVIGVGDKTAPKHGAGTLYIDDIAVGRPAQ